MTLDGVKIAETAANIRQGTKNHGKCAAGVSDLLRDILKIERPNNGGSASGSYNLFEKNKDLQNLYTIPPKEILVTNEQLKKLHEEGKIPPGTIVMTQYKDVNGRNLSHNPWGHIYISAGIPFQSKDKNGNAITVYGSSDGVQANNLFNGGVRSKGGAVFVKLLLPKEYSSLALTEYPSGNFASSYTSYSSNSKNYLNFSFATAGTTGIFTNYFQEQKDKNNLAVYDEDKEEVRNEEQNAKYFISNDNSLINNERKARKGKGI